MVTVVGEEAPDRAALWSCNFSRNLSAGDEELLLLALEVSVNAAMVRFLVMKFDVFAETSFAVAVDRRLAIIQQLLLK
jgi:hypothetical protein